MQRLMGDWLRRLLYPLVLPVIVGTVWVCARARQIDDRAVDAGWIFSGPVHDLRSNPTAARTVRLPFKTEFFAAADAADEEETDEP